MAAKGAETLFNALLITDVGIDPFKDGKFAAWLHRNHHPRLRHEHGQADRFQGHRLAARVWPGNHDDKGLIIQIDINRHDGLRVEQGMARPVQVDHRTRMQGRRTLFSLFQVTVGCRFRMQRGLGRTDRHHFGGRGFQRVRILGFGKGKVEFTQDLAVAPDINHFVGHQFGQLGENAAHFFFFLQFELAHRIVLLHHLERLNE